MQRVRLMLESPRFVWRGKQQGVRRRVSGCSVSKGLRDVFAGRKRCFHCFRVFVSVAKSSSATSALKHSGLLCPWDSPDKDTGVGCHSLLQGIFPTQGSNPGHPHCRRILYQLCHQGSPKFWLHPPNVRMSPASSLLVRTRPSIFVVGAEQGPSV